MTELNESAPKPQAEGTTWRSAVRRIGLILLLLVVVTLARLDRAVTVATQVDWLPKDARAARDSSLGLESLYWCDDHPCLRLPGTGVWVYAATSVLVAALAAGVLFGLSRGLAAPERTVWKRFFGRASLIALLIGLVATALRIGYAHGSAVMGEWVSGLALLQWGVIIGVAALIARVWARARASQVGTKGPWTWLRDLLGRHRLQLALVLGYVVLVLIVPTSSEQFFDAVRGIGFDSVRGVSAFGFLLASAVLFALVVYEGGLRLDKDGDSKPADAVSKKTWLWLAVAALVAHVIGSMLSLGPGFAIAVGILLVLAALEALAPKGQAPPGPASSGAVDLSDQRTGERRFVAHLAAVPLVTLAAAMVAAVVDMIVIEGEHTETVAPLVIGAIVLSAAAFVMVAESPSSLSGNGRFHIKLAAWIWVVLATLAVIGILLLPGRWPILAAVGALLLTEVLFGYLVWIRILLCGRRTERSRAPVSAGWSIPVAVAAGLGTFVAVHIAPIDTGVVVGSIGLINLAATAIAALLFFVAMAVNHYKPPVVLRWFGLRRLPVLSLIVIWSIVATFLAPAGINDVRQVPRTGTAAAPTLQTAFESWLESQPEFERSGDRFGTASGTDPHPVPLVLVASHGGGIRAAYWTALVMNCIVGASPKGTRQPLADPVASRSATCEDRRRDSGEMRAAASRVFLGSGVSGGGVGLAAYAKQLLSGDLGDGSWVDRRVGNDLLAPTVGWGLFHDLPNHFVGTTPGERGSCRLSYLSQCLTQDRATILEQTFDGIEKSDHLLRQAWDDRTSTEVETAVRAKSVPLLAINASTPHTGLRAVASAADLGGWPRDAEREPATGKSIPHPVAGTADVSNMLCAQWDIRLSTAAMLGARFPLVSPPGRIAGNCGVTPGEPIPREDDGTPCATGDTYCQTHMVDGGYVDNSGLLTIALLWPELRRLVQAQNSATPTTPIAVVVLDIDSKYQNDGAFREPTSGGLPELMPGMTLLGTSAAIEAAARGAVQQAVPAPCFVSIAPQLHPGLTAPLGWTLSESSKADLREGLVRPASSAQGEFQNWPVRRLRQLQEWLDPPSSSPRLTSELASCVPIM